MVLDSTANLYYKVDYMERGRVISLRLEAIAKLNRIILLLIILKYSKGYLN